jgi:dihydroflavonol-4-reductase
MGVERCRERSWSQGSGYIAGFLIRQLLAEGWRVHATLRDPAKGPPCVPCWVERRKRFLFPGRSAAVDQRGRSLGRCSACGACPFPFTLEPPRNDEDLIRPACEGVLRALRFAVTRGGSFRSDLVGGGNCLWARQRVSSLYRRDLE